MTLSRAPEDTRTPKRTANSSTRGNWALRDRPSLVWLILAGVVALAHRWIPAATWLMVHLVLLGALTHAAMVWSTHFTQALLKTPPGLDDRKRQSQRLTLLLLGTTLVLVGVPTVTWPLTVAGATLVCVAVVWHAVMLWRRLRTALPGRFRVTVRYYLAAAAYVPVGATFGTVLAKGVPDELNGRLLVAHTMTMLLGWLGLTVTGTLVTLWPTMLRTRMDERAERLARQALPGFVTAVAVVLTGASLGLRWVAVAGLVLYGGCLAWWGRALWRPARTAPPRHFGTWSVSAALGWLVVALVLVTVSVAVRPDWTAVADGYGTIATVIAAGFAVQLISGALAWLMPSVLGGGPSVVRAAAAWFNRYAVLRLAVVNLGLLLCLLPVPSWVRVVLSVLVLVAMAAYVPLFLKAVRASVAARQELLAAFEAGDARPTRIDPEPPVWSTGQLVAALAVLAVGISLGVAVDPAAAGLPVASGVSASTGQGAGPGLSAPGVRPTGRTTTVRVEAHDMRFSPGRITVPYGNRLVVDLVNTDRTSPHDLTFDGVTRTPRLMPGQSATLDAGIVGRSNQGWCTLVGHRQMGMVLDVVVEGAPAGTSGASAGMAGMTHDGGTSATATPGIRLGQEPGPDFRAVDPVLAPLTNERIHRLTLVAEDKTLEIAPGVRQIQWTYNGRVPGPTLHGRVGDTFEITLVNKGTIGHSIDFHAGENPPNRDMRTIPPGQSLVYRFTAKRAGIWLYHCSTMPMSAHIAAGMFGAVVIEPDGLPAVDRSYLAIQSEAYVTGDGSTPEPVDVEAVIAAARPSALAFNGIANQYDYRPWPAKTGERVRIWVLDAGPNRATSFHVVGSQFDTVWKEGGYLLRAGKDAFGSTGGGAQALDLAAAQGGFVELSIPEPGRYPFVSHIMADAEIGAHGILEVTR